MTIEDYAFARAEFYTHRRTLADYAARLSQAAALLREATDRVGVTGAGLGAPAAGGPDLIDGAGLPGAADIQRVLVRYRWSYERLRAVWDGLPHDARAGLSPPPPDLPTLAPEGAVPEAA